MSTLKRIVLDTNFLMIPGELGVDIFEQLASLDFPYKLCVYERTLTELENIIEKDKRKYRTAARIARELIKAKNIVVIAGDEPVDEALVKLSQQRDVVIATQDQELKRRLSGPKLVLRQKKYLQLVN
jgi:uncharacterized protein